MTHAPDRRIDGRKLAWATAMILQLATSGILLAHVSFLIRGWLGRIYLAPFQVSDLDTFVTWTTPITVTVLCAVLVGMGLWVLIKQPQWLEAYCIVVSVVCWAAFAYMTWVSYGQLEGCFFLLIMRGCPIFR